jgi:hypothetical protein
MPPYGAFPSQCSQLTKSDVYCLLDEHEPPSPISDDPVFTLSMKMRHVTLGPTLRVSRAVSGYCPLPHGRRGGQLWKMRHVTLGPTLRVSRAVSGCCPLPHGRRGGQL